MLTLTERLQTENEMLRRTLENLKANFHCAKPGIVEALNDDGTVNVQVAIREQVNINGDLQWMDIPLLLDCPVAMHCSDKYMVVSSIKKGDECLVVFADNCIDAWWQSGGVQNQIEKRRHDLSDGIAIFGIRSLPRKTENFPTDGIQVRNEDGSVKIEITGTTINLNTSGNINITGGNVSISGNSKIDNKAFLSHTHSAGLLLCSGIPVTGTSGGVS
jgi:hypothetical protein